MNNNMMYTVLINNYNEIVSLLKISNNKVVIDKFYKLLYDYISIINEYHKNNYNDLNNIYKYYKKLEDNLL